MQGAPSLLERRRASNTSLVRQAWKSGGPGRAAHSRGRPQRDHAGSARAQRLLPRVPRAGRHELPVIAARDPINAAGHPQTSAGDV